MKHYIQPTLGENRPEKILLFLQDIINCDIVTRGDDLNVKGKAANKCFKTICKSKNVWFLEHTNITPGTYLDRSKLHLNQKETTLLASDFMNVFKRV